MFAKTDRRYATPVPGIKGRRPARQRPTARDGGRFGEVVLWGRPHSGLNHKVQTTRAVFPACGRALPACVGAIPGGHALPATHPARRN